MQMLSSKQVAEMLGRRHDNFVRAIRKLATDLGEEAPKYFVEGMAEGRAKNAYGITLAGCDLIAGRIIGAKSTAFKDQYLPLFGKTPDPAQEPVTMVKPEPKRYTVQEVAEALGMNERSVRRYIEKGILKAEKVEVMVPTVKTLISEEEFKAFMADRGRA